MNNRERTIIVGLVAAVVLLLAFFVPKVAGQDLSGLPAECQNFTPLEEGWRVRNVRPTPRLGVRNKLGTLFLGAIFSSEREMDLEVSVEVIGLVRGDEYHWTWRGEPAGNTYFRVNLVPLAPGYEDQVTKAYLATAGTTCHAVVSGLDLVEGPQADDSVAIEAAFALHLRLWTDLRVRTETSTESEVLATLQWDGQKWVVGTTPVEVVPGNVVVGGQYCFPDRWRDDVCATREAYGLPTNTWIQIQVFDLEGNLLIEGNMAFVEAP